MAARKCPECGVSVKVENLPAHYEKLHPRAEVPEAVVEASTEAARAAKVERPPRRGPSASERRLYLVVLVIIVVAVVAFIGLQSLVTGLVGKAAPDFTLTNTSDGTAVKPAYAGRVVLLDFMRTTCEYCQAFTAQTLVPLHSSANGSRVLIVSVDINVGGDDLATGNTRVNSFKTQYGATWAYALDVRGEVTKVYGVSVTPTHFIVDKTGKIVDMHTGAESLATLTARLAQYW